MEKAKTGTFESQNSFEKMKGEIFYTNPEEIVYGVSIAKSYLDLYHIIYMMMKQLNGGSRRQMEKDLWCVNVDMDREKSALRNRIDQLPQSL